MGKFFFAFFCFDFILFVWDPRECRISAHLWAFQKAGFRHPILILSPLVMYHYRPLVGPTYSDFVCLSLGIPENAGVM